MSVWNRVRTRTGALVHLSTSVKRTRDEHGAEYWTGVTVCGPRRAVYEVLSPFRGGESNHEPVTCGRCLAIVRQRVWLILDTSAGSPEGAWDAMPRFDPFREFERSLEATS